MSDKIYFEIEPELKKQFKQKVLDNDSTVKEVLTNSIKQYLNIKQ